MTLALLIGIVSAVALLLSGFLFGARQGRAARRELHSDLQRRNDELLRTKAQVGQVHPAPDALREDLGRLVAPLLRQSEAVQGLQEQLRTLAHSLNQRNSSQQALGKEMQQYLRDLKARPTDTDRVRQDLERLLKPLINREGEEQTLRAQVQELLSPLMQREQLGYELSRLELGTGKRGELPRLLDDIAAKGGFAAVLLSDEAGLPLASSRNADNLERLAGISSLLLLLADRVTRDNAPAPLAVLVHDEANQTTLNRIFRVSGQRLLLTAISSGTALAPTALDPALTKLEAVLSTAHGPA